MLTRLDNMDELIEAIKTVYEADDNYEYAAEYIDCAMPGIWWGDAGNAALRELRQHTHDWEHDATAPRPGTPEFAARMEFHNSL